MDSKTTQNIQDSFLNAARKDKLPVTTYLVSGVKLTGRIRAFDKYSVVMDTNNQEQLIFKHAIASVVMARGSRHTESAPAAAHSLSPEPTGGEPPAGPGVRGPGHASAAGPEESDRASSKTEPGTGE